MIYLIALCLLSVSIAAPTNEPTVTIADGPVIGVPTQISGSSVGVNKYLGIPFAVSPPVRFTPPENPRNWSTPLRATSFKPACIQQFTKPDILQVRINQAFNTPPPPGGESEDCLYLNVFAPTGPAPAGGRAVLFWIFGGNLQLGTGGLAFYDGSSFAANQDVVVVTSNYRTNAFGFVNSPEVPFGLQNPGLLDQRKALAWVQQNVRMFGGDPSKITIFGESAGGYSVKQLLATHPDPLPFRAAIMQSQQLLPALPDDIPYNRLLIGAGCIAAASPLGCLRALPASTIKNVIERDIIFFNPVADNVTAVEDVRDTIGTETFARVPIMLGTNRDEVTVFVWAFGIEAVTDFVGRYVPNPLNPIRIIGLLPSLLLNIPFSVISRVGTDYFFTCNSADLAERLAGAGSAVWRYYYEAVFPNLSLFDGAGAWHTSEIPQIFGTYDRNGATTRQAEVSRFMQKAWADFAKSPERGPGWSRFGGANGRGELAVIGREGGPISLNVPATSIDQRCAVYRPFLPILPL